MHEFKPTVTKQDADSAGVPLKLLEQWEHILTLLWTVSLNCNYAIKNNQNRIQLHNDIEIVAYIINNKYIDARIEQNDKELLTYRYDGNDVQLVQVFHAFLNKN